MQNLIKELEQGTVTRRVSTLDLRAARAIKELYEAYTLANQFRVMHQDMAIGPFLEDCRFHINEVVSRENLECIS